MSTPVMKICQSIKVAVSFFERSYFQYGYIFLKKRPHKLLGRCTGIVLSNFPGSADNPARET